MNRFARRGALAAAGIVAVAAVWWTLLGRTDPMATPGPARPAATYAEALARIDSIRALEGRDILPACRTRALVVGDRTANVIVLFHGFTNCPKQFDSLATILVRSGANVVLPRVPRHGLGDRMTPELTRLTAEELTRSGMAAVDIARGLGARVTVAGLSSSAVLAAWLAQNRADVDRAVLLAPSFAPRGMEAAVARRLTNAMRRAPNFFVWWDRKRKAQVPGPRQCYPRFASRALAEVYRLGFTVLDEADRAAPKAAQLAILTTASDEGVNNDLAQDLARRWRSRGAYVQTYEFPESLDVRHDMIDPEQPYQRIHLSYPVIERALVGMDDPS
ncbi:MAG TPA: alpha/beta fold hydrolase [Candidatus Eisenbacteria bacterium]|nr:alpha/beta fold hydrolase [Candidatus Eisenbacteria bacterium]